jgi:hypothetical protein
MIREVVANRGGKVDIGAVGHCEAPMLPVKDTDEALS